MRGLLKERKRDTKTAIDVKIMSKARADAGPTAHPLHLYLCTYTHVSREIMLEFKLIFVFKEELQ